MTPTLLIFYLLIFFSILYFKYLFSVKVIFNSVWFSLDGSIPETSIENLIDIKNKINRSFYKKNYKLYLWTDKTILSKSIKKKLKKHAIVIMDYQQNIKINDDASLAINKWIKKLIKINSPYTKLHLAMASDLFRIFLVTKELPRKYPRAISIYLDCNDKTLADIPNPKSLRDMKGIAFPRYKISDNFRIIKKLKSTEYSQHWFNNDIIIANHYNNKDFLDGIFQCYYYYLNSIKNIINTYIEIINHITTIDTQTQILFAFSTTHTINFLCQRGEDARNVYLLDDRIKRIENIYNVHAFINIERINTSLSWIKDDTHETYHNKIRELCLPLLRS